MRLRRVFQALWPRRLYTIFAGTNDVRDAMDGLLFGILGRRAAGEGLIERYEHAFAAATGCSDAVAFASGRMSLYAILKALGIGSGDEVIIQFTCVVVPNAIIYAGAKPVYVDIDSRTFNIDVTKVEAAITPRTKAIYAQHTFGLICDVDALRAIAKRHGLVLIEDSAHCIGAELAGRKAGSLGDVALFSTDHSKMINTHLGGMVTTNDRALAAKLRRIQEESPSLSPLTERQIAFSLFAEWLLFAPMVAWLGVYVHMILAKLGLLFFFRDERLLQKPVAYPYPAKLAPVAASVGLRQLRRLPENLAHRRELAKRLEIKIGWNRGLVRPNWHNHAFLRYSLLVRDRDVIECQLRRFSLGVWFRTIAGGREENLHEVGYVSGSCPVTEHVCRHILNFPTHTRIPWSALERALATLGPSLTAEVLSSSAPTPSADKVQLGRNS